LATSLVSKILSGSVQAASRLISRLEEGKPNALEEVDSLYPHTGKAFIVGVTGTPGAGKSTLTDNLISAFRAKGLTVGAIVIDPTSALSGGAILGDRIRMRQHSTDKEVFIRSLATRGWAGGLTKAAMGTIRVMDAMGKDLILIETVGTGQVETDISQAADTTLVVLTPTAGDEIQMMKAGILEAADIFVINKADKGGADSIRADLEVMLGMRPRQAAGWLPPILLTEAIKDKGTAQLTESIYRHQQFLTESGGREKRRRARVKLELIETVTSFFKRFIHGIDNGNHLEKLVDDLAQGKTTPHAAVTSIANRLTESSLPDNSGAEIQPQP